MWAAVILNTAQLVVAPVCFGGRVAIDRRDVGHLPLPAVTVAAGFHLVEVLCPAKARWHRLVYLADGTTIALAVSPRAPDPPVAAIEGPGTTAAGPPARVSSPAPRFELSGRAGLAGRFDGKNAETSATWAAQSWDLAYGVPDDGWRATFRPRARHGITGDDRRTRWAVDELRLRSARLAGVAVAGGRWQSVFPGEVPETWEGGAVDGRVGPWRGALAGAWARERETPLGALSAGFADADVSAAARAEVGEAGVRGAVSASGAPDGPWCWSFQTAATDGAPAFAEGMIASRSLGPDDPTAGGARVDLRVGGQWRAVALDRPQTILDTPKNTLAGVEGALWSAAANARFPGPDGHAADARLELDAGAEGQRLGLWLGGRAARLLGTWRPAVAADHVRRPEGAAFSTWSRLTAGVEGRPSVRWRLTARVGPERLVFDRSPASAAPLQYVGGRGTAGFALDAGVWLRAEVTHGALDPAAGDSPTPSRGLATTAFLGLEVW